MGRISSKSDRAGEGISEPEKGTQKYLQRMRLTKGENDDQIQKRAEGTWRDEFEFTK